MLKGNSFFRYILLLTLLIFAGSASVWAAPVVIPQSQAAHFCKLLVHDGSSVLPLSSHAHQLVQPEDSLSVEQIFAGYILLADNWQTMRIFPHEEDGKVTWYSASEQLPSSMDAEHQKYIHEVFPRLVQQVRAGEWATVDAYIDRMLEYQCEFGGQVTSSPVSSTLLISIAAIFLVLILVFKLLLLTLHPKRK